MLVNQASGIRGGVYMGRGLTSCLNALFGKGKKTVLHKMMDGLENVGYVEVFNHIDNTKEDIAVAGEEFVITLYGGDRKIGCPEI